MILNRMEFYLMNNPLRRIIRDKYEVRILRKRSDLPVGKHVLEIGCGDGSGTVSILKQFSPKSIQAIDLDPRMIAIAKGKVRHKSTHFSVASATKLPFKDNQFDAVFVLGILHHVPDWRAAISEIYRVLRPGGQLIMEDLSIDTFQSGLGKLMKPLLAHPYSEMYSEKEILSYLKMFRVVHKSQYPLHLLRYFILVAKKMR